jgi:hypothetical protein
MKIQEASLEKAQALRRESKALAECLTMLKDLKPGQARLIEADEGETINGIRNKIMRAKKVLNMTNLVVKRRGNQIALWYENGTAPKRSKRQSKK